MKNPQRLELLNNEYTMLQQFYQDIDNRGLTIKGWSVTVSLAGIGAGLLYSGWIFLGVMGAALLFWYLEGYWRGLSFFFSRRILAIEAAIREGTWKEMDPLQIYHAWDEAYQVSGPDITIHAETPQPLASRPCCYHQSAPVRPGDHRHHQPPIWVDIPT